MAHQKQFAFSWQSQLYTLTVFSRGYINSPAWCRNFLQRDLDHLLLPKIITLVHYVDDVLTSPNEQDAATTLYLLVSRSYQRMRNKFNQKFKGLLLQ